MLKYSYLLTNILSQNFQRAHGAMNFHLPVPSLPARIEIFNNEVRNKKQTNADRKSCGSEILRRIYICLSYYTFSRFFFCLNLKRNMTENTEEQPVPGTRGRAHCYRVHTKNCNHFSRTFQGLFKDHIRFSRTTYKENNFTSCTKMHIPSLELFASPTSLHFSVHLS